MVSRTKAARDYFARRRRTPSEIEAVVRSLMAYDGRPWPNKDELEQPVEWLTEGAGCTARTGTVYDARIAARYACTAALSILVDVPLGQPEDEAALLDLLRCWDWHLPLRQRERVAKRMARYVSDRIMGKYFEAETKARYVAGH
jgi:hypothetical protein